MSSLTVRLGKLRLKNPTLLASGILCQGSLLRRALEEGAGGVVTKSLTLERREGYPTPVVVGVRGGLVNAVGLANQGAEEYLKRELPLAKKGGGPVIVSVAGGETGEFVRLASMAEEAGADAVELNLSCPHVRGHGLEIGKNPKLVRRIVGETKGILSIPLYAKMGYSDRLLASSLSAEEGGADGVVAINTLPAMAVDVYTRRFILSHGMGGLSGPALHPVALRCVYELHRVLSVPVIGCGGVEDWKTAAEFILAGAKAVQVGSAVATRGLGVFSEICRGLSNYLKREGIESIDNLVGRLEG
ncbi:MAG: dihydroorotate dehydrogenase, partial [Hadesarchaea archaeon]|jgi:dihydroorotate dehydrogenase (NAD+) catalytic subunit